MANPGPTGRPACGCVNSIAEASRPAADCRSSAPIPLGITDIRTCAARILIDGKSACRYANETPHARVAELVDAGDSKSPAARLAGSSPASGTSRFTRGRQGGLGVIDETIDSLAHHFECPGLVTRRHPSDHASIAVPARMRERALADVSDSWQGPRSEPEPGAAAVDAGMSPQRERIVAALRRALNNSVAPRQGDSMPGLTPLSTCRT